MKIGDKVRFISEVGGGVVSGFQGKNIVLVQDEDGFDIPMAINDVVVIGEEDYNKAHLPYGKPEPKKPDNRSVKAIMGDQSNIVDNQDNEEDEVDFSKVTFRAPVEERKSVDTWARTAIVSIVLVLLLVLLYLFAPSINLRKVGFFGAILFLALFLLSNLFAYQQKQLLMNRSGAIVIAPTVNVKKTPAVSSNDSFVIHEGTRVNITDKSIKGWRSIALADGREGWVLERQIEEI